MKRMLALILAALMLLSVTACKPDNIQYPAEITDPAEETTGETEKEAGTDTDVSKEETDETTKEADSETVETSGSVEETPAQETVASADASATSTDENEKTTDSAESKSEGEATSAEETAPTNPLAAEDFTPSTGLTGLLPTSGILKNGSTASALKNRTITYYTADDVPAFFYTDEKGNEVTEWEWAESLSSGFSFKLKYIIKNAEISLRSQRIALWSGKELSLIQMKDEDLALGMSLSRSAKEYLNENVSLVGISNAVLTQSEQTLFAPAGYVNTLWYNPELLPEGTDPEALSAAGEWTVEQFKAICTENANNGNLSIINDHVMDWALLSGKSPLTFSEGKLSSNLYDAATQPVWEAIRKMNTELPHFLPDEDITYSFTSGNVAMKYTSDPSVPEKGTSGFTSLPALEKGGSVGVSFAGTFFALPKYQRNEGKDLAALTFAELWCNRYTEVRAGQLKAAGVSGARYTSYLELAEGKGQLVLRSTAIDTLTETFLKGLDDTTIQMDEAYSAIETQLKGKLLALNL